MKGRIGRQAETKIVQDIEELRTYESNQKSILTNEDSMTCYECQTEIKNKKLAMHLRETTFFAGKPVLKKRCFCSVGCEETWVIRKVDCSTQSLKITGALI